VISAAVFVDPTDLSEYVAVHQIFLTAGIMPLLKSKSAAGSSGPNEALHYPLPSVVFEAAWLITEVLRRAFGVTEHAPLLFSSR